jgi:hypothetical protein
MLADYEIEIALSSFAKFKEQFQTWKVIKFSPRVVELKVKRHTPYMSLFSILLNTQS